MNESWTLRSFNIIVDAFNEMRNNKINECLTDEQIFRKVSLERYPFGERANWPYKAWLKALKQVKQFRRNMVYNATGIDPALALKARKKQSRKTKVVDRQQERLIGME
jgi:hypothetical protein